MSSVESPQVIPSVGHKSAEAIPVQVVTTEISDLSVSGQGSPVPASRSDETATRILRIIEQYGLNYERTGSWDGFDTFFPIVLGQVSRGEPVKMLLPGFPFKSPNSRDKVLSNLPDLGEELALQHLNGLCENIKTVYEHGAEVHITSDGLVYNDLLGVPDEDVWNFGEAVRQITVDHGLHHLSFLRLWDLLGTPGTWSKEHYLANAANIRQDLNRRYGDPQFEADMANKSSSDMQMTHTKYLEFLKSDLLLNEKWLAQSAEEQAVTIADTAKAMMGRWKAFAAALEANRTDYVRLSIHDSGGKDKLSMALITQKQRGALGATPWHSVVVAELDGNYRSVQRHTVDQEKYELIYRNGRPYFFRAKSDLFNWSVEGCDVTFEHLYPTGLIVRPTSEAPSITAIPMTKVRILANTFSPVVLRGFSNTAEKDIIVKSAHAFGEAGRDDSTEPVLGGSTKVLSITDPSYIAIAPKGSGKALFTPSRLFFRYLSSPWSVERLEAVVQRPHDTEFNIQDQKQLRLIVKHPVTGEPCLRWLDSKNRTRLTTRDLILANDDEMLIDVINAGIYDWRSCLRFCWNEGDVLVSDATATLHIITSDEIEEL
ncbi:putative pyoverdine/dityrosine biosynthesis protein [Boeremia exigua]|uniref:putative pyoverdine/dityrosine biosynthesis protein n=1 Tax=Boeremia exigua TaxID=749465 RepID=UPI001E8D4FD8|nr:putative pyoverdine/dityrosine biosynthesis protein [Boeremia exigua]KAH6642954.1 putative pyoverdine/dityrosine biosynthesis protein [Boeremia exigua]